MGSVGENAVRKDAADKVTGKARFAADRLQPGTLEARLLTSRRAHARIKKIDTAKAKAAPGVVGVVSGAEASVLCGVLLADRPLLAQDVVRYDGEPLAVVIAHTEREALAAIEQIAVEYEDLPVVGSVADALKPQATLVHEQLGSYTALVDDVYSRFCSTRRWGAASCSAVSASTVSRSNSVKMRM